MISTSLKTLFCALSLCVLTTLASSSFAGTINYPGPDTDPNGNEGWMGTDVWYSAVRESNDDTAMRFGAPSGVAGNSIDFDPENFEASTSGTDSEIVDSQLNFMVLAKGNAVIDNIQFSEAGDTQLFAFDPDRAFTSVAANFFIDVVAVDGVPLGVPLNIVSSLGFIPSDGDFDTTVDGSPGFNSPWTGSVFVDIKQALIDAGIEFVGGATKINVALDNTLTAGSLGPSASAFIRKKDADGLTVTTNIPEPATATLLLVGLLGGLSRRKRG